MVILNIEIIFEMRSHKQENLRKTRKWDPELFAKSKRPTYNEKPLFQNFRCLNGHISKSGQKVGFIKLHFFGPEFSRVWYHVT